MKLFARKKQTANAGDDVVAHKLAAGIIARQRQLADYLNGKTLHLTPRFWKYAIVAFCAGFGGYCVYLVVSALS